MTLYASKPHIGKLRFALEKLREMRDTNSFDVLAVIIPMLNGNIWNGQIYEAVYDILNHEFGRVGFRTISMYSDFSAASFERLKVADFDSVHPNALGHELIAERLFEELQNHSIAGQPSTVSGHTDSL